MYDRNSQSIVDLNKRNDKIFIKILESDGHALFT